MQTKMTIAQRPEYAQKPKPVTAMVNDRVRESVAKMARHNYGCVVVVDAAGQVEGILTERDILKRLIDQDLDAHEVTVGEIMTSNPRVARRSDLVVDWLRIMSNERFRRLPIVDENGRLEAIFTQGDFVSYTWPELRYEPGGQSAPPVIPLEWRAIALIAGAIGGYTLLMAVIFNLL